MRYQEITNIEELKVFMDVEAEKCGHSDSDLAPVNGSGIESQWQGLLKRDTWPNIIHAIIKQPNDYIPQMLSFWIDKEGQRVERPNNG